MKKHINLLKRQVLAVLIVVMAMSVVVPVQVSAEGAQSWQRAFSELLRANNFAREFALHDFNNDGIPELVVKYHNLVIYRYSNGQVEAVYEHDPVMVLLHMGNNEMFVRYDPRNEWVTHYEFIDNRFMSTLVSTLSFDWEGDDLTEHYLIHNQALYDRLNTLTPTLPQFHANTPANIAAHIYGTTATTNSHPFATELQNIINSLQAGHTYIRATLINLDKRGEQQGVVVITRWQNVIDATIVYMVSNNIRTYEVGSFELGMPANLNLSENNMLVTFVFGWDASTELQMHRLHDGELQTNSLRHVMDMEGVEGYEGTGFYYVGWTTASDGGEINIITRNRYNELLREFGLVGYTHWVDYSYWLEDRFPDQTDQILAMQAPATMQTQPTTAPTQNDAITVTINGTPAIFTDQLPVIVNGRTLVPVRGVFEALGFDVSWNEQARQATLSRADATIVITIDSATFTTNGVSHALDVPAQIIGGRTMIPLRAVLESVGYELAWDENTQTVIIFAN